MNAGIKYRIRYKNETQRKVREAVGTYLGKNENGDLLFDARPAAGTQTIPAMSLLGWVAVDPSTPHRMPKN